MRSRDEIRSVILASSLADVIFGDIFDFEEEPSVAAELASLHNDGEIDVLEIAGTSLAGLAPHKFFGGQNLLLLLIPSLEAPTSAMMSFVDALVTKGGSDMAANRPNAAFVNWCAAKPSRARQILEAARQGERLATEHLSFALTADGTVEDACEFLKLDDNRRQAALAALARMKTTLSSATIALSKMRELISIDQSDRTVASVLGAAFDIASRHRRLAKHRWTPIVMECCLLATGPHALYQGAQALWSHEALLNGPITTALLRALRQVAPDQRGTIDQLDLGLSRLVGTETARAAAELVGYLVLEHNGEIPLSSFDGFFRRMIEQHRRSFYKILVSWLLNGDPHLCDGLHTVIQKTLGTNPSFDIEFRTEGLSEIETLFVCRKAIGYFFFSPVTAASILVSALRSCGGEVASKVSSLLFDPLLINFGGATGKYLRSLPTDDAAFDGVSAALAAVDSYIAALETIGEIPELRPSERQIQLERARWHDVMKRSMKEAESESVLFGLFSRSTILYGLRSLTHVLRPGDEAPHKVAIELHQHSTTFEWPRMEAVDPQGLNYILRLFQAERLRS